MFRDNIVQVLSSGGSLTEEKENNILTELSFYRITNNLTTTTHNTN